MPPWPKGSVDRLEDRKESLSLFRRLEAFHLPLSCAGWLMGVLGSVIKIAALPMNHAGQDQPFRRSVTSELVRNDDTRPSLCRVEQLAKETQGCPTIAARLHQNIDDRSVLVHGSPQIVLDSIHLDEHFVKVPFCSEPNSLLPQLGGVNGAELLAPFSDRFIRHWDASLRHHLFDIPIAQGKAKVQPYALLHNLDWETVPTISALRRFHNASFSHFLKLTMPWRAFN